MNLLEGRIAIVTGAGRGIGRAHALELARQGAKVVVNDFGVSLAGETGTESPADSVVSEIKELGGEAVANGADVAEFAQAEAMVQQAIDTFGGLDILVNNAGFVRDRMLVNTSEEEWDAVIRVHLKGHFAPLRHAGAYWEGRSGQGWIRIESPLDRASRDAERVRRWLAEDDRDYLVRVYAAVIAEDPTIARTPACAVISDAQLEPWLRSLPVQRSLSQARRNQLVARLVGHR